MRAFGQYILRSHPALVVLMVLVLASLPLASALAGVIMALVILRTGPRFGLWLVFAACVPSLAIVAVSDAPGLGAVINIAGYVMLAIAAYSLYVRASWQLVLQVTSVLAVLAIVVVHILGGDVAHWWYTHLQTLLVDVQSLPESEQKILLQAGQQGARIMTGLAAAGVLATTWLWLALARWWQAVLFNPGQLRPELHSIRLSRGFAIIALLLGILAWVTKEPGLIDLLPVIMLPFMVVTLSLVHRLIAQRKLSPAWLIGFYFVVVLLFSTVVLALTVVGWLDSLLQQPLPEKRGQ